ncbi:MAG: hypothetical protein ACK5M7_03045 [Draconibacterium sp.]
MSFTVYNWTPILIPLVIGACRYSSLDRPARILFYFVVYGTTNELLGFVLRFIVRVHNTMPLSNLYFMSEFLLLGLLYRELLKDRYPSSAFIGIILLFELASIVNLLFFQSLYEYPSLLQTISKIFLIGFSLLYFYKIMDEAKIENLWKEPTVFVNVAVLVYYSGNLFFSLLFNVILEYSRAFSKMTVVYYSILNALFYFLIAYSFMLAGKNRKH